MISALRYEWLRIRTIRSTWWLTVMTLVVGVGVSFLIAWGFSQALKSEAPPPQDDIDMLGPVVVAHASGAGAPYAVPYILAMIGVFAWGHEYRHGMIRATLTALPSRANALTAKYVVVGIWVVVVTAVTLALGIVMGWLWLRDDEISFTTGEVWRTAGLAVGYTLVFTLLVTAFTAIIRHQAAALVFMFLWPLAIEDILSLIPRLVPGLDHLLPLTRFLPFNAGLRMLRNLEEYDSVFGDPLSPLGGFVVFGAFAAVLIAASAVLFQKRDA